MSGSLLVVPEHLAGVSSSCAGEVSHTSREFVLHVVLVDVLPVISALLERPVVGAPRDEVQLVNHQDLLVPLGPQVVTGDVPPSRNAPVQGCLQPKASVQFKVSPFL